MDTKAIMIKAIELLEEDHKGKSELPSRSLVEYVDLEVFLKMIFELSRENYGLFRRFFFMLWSMLIIFWNVLLNVGKDPVYGMGLNRVFVHHLLIHEVLCSPKWYYPKSLCRDNQSTFTTVHEIYTISKSNDTVSNVKSSISVLSSIFVLILWLPLKIFLNFALKTIAISSVVFVISASAVFLFLQNARSEGVDILAKELEYQATSISHTIASTSISRSIFYQRARMYHDQLIAMKENIDICKKDSKCEYIEHISVIESYLDSELENLANITIFNKLNPHDMSNSWNDTANFIKVIPSLKGKTP